VVALMSFVGALFEDYREERLPGLAVGSLHHAKRRLPTADQLIGVRCVFQDIHLHHRSYFVLGSPPSHTRKQNLFLCPSGPLEAAGSSCRNNFIHLPEEKYFPCNPIYPII
jgi:hypothetical protein